MEQKTLPNSTLILILGILSILFCCCYGIPALFSGGVTLFLASKATKLYNENPEMYTGYSNVKTGKMLAIAGIVFAVLYLIFLIVYFAMVGSMAAMDHSMYM